MIRRFGVSLPFLILTAILLAGCIEGGHDDSPDATVPEPPEPPPVNPFLAESIVPIAHGNSAQTDSVDIAGPSGPTETLTESELGLSYQHLGPAHFGIAIAPQYPDGRRTIWSNGRDRISKLDYDTLAVIHELILPVEDPPASFDWPLPAAVADAEIAQLDTLRGDALEIAGLTMGALYLAGLDGVYYLLDAENTLFVGGSRSILAYRDVNPLDSRSPIELREEWQKPVEIGGGFAGANITFDGYIAMVTNEGWVVVVKRDFSEYHAIQLPGAEAAPAHNKKMDEEGHRPGSAYWVRNSLAVDKDGGIYVPSLEHMHKVVWDGTRLSNDPADGAWSAPYSNSSSVGSGATPTLMGFGDEDRFVVLTDGDVVMNVELFWRDEIPAGWQTPAGALSSRTAGKARVDMGNDAIEAIQTEQSVVVGGYGAFVVNNAPATNPNNRPPGALVGYLGHDPTYTPHGMQKFEWDPITRQFAEDWVNTEVSSANSVPIISTGSNLVYTVGARDRNWTLEALDWDTGASAFHFVTGSSRYNSLFSGINLDQEGRVIHTTIFGIVRYERFPEE